MKDNPSKSLPWQDACRKLGTTKISEMGENDPRKPSGLNSSGVAGIQMADVSVDVETGIVKMNKFVAVQDCGMIVNHRTAESQIDGAIIMGICAALFEERVMDEQKRQVPERRCPWSSTSWQVSPILAKSMCISTSRPRTISAA